MLVYYNLKLEIVGPSESNFFIRVREGKRIKVMKSPVRQLDCKTPASDVEHQLVKQSSS